MNPGQTADVARRVSANVAQSMQCNVAPEKSHPTKFEQTSDVQIRDKVTQYSNSEQV
jgi:hypothetical protein